jgi:hypothetical protein
MAYQKTNWKTRIGSNLSRFSKEQETTRSVVLRNEPSGISQQGTPFSSANMNKIEQGIYDAHKLLEGIHITGLNGATLTRIIGGTTEIAKILFTVNTFFVEGKTIVFDTNGTTGVYIGDVNGATINVLTTSIPPHGSDYPTRLGRVAAHADLPLTVPAATAVFGRTPHLDDYAFVIVDETMDRATVEWIIIEITTNGNITWGSPFTISGGIGQQPTVAQDAGRVLVGGQDPGTFGQSLAVDTAPTQDSGNLITSNGVFSWFGAALSTLKTTAKTLIGAVNELFDNKLDKTAQAADSARLGNQLPSAFAQANAVANLSGNQTIQGEKTFTSFPRLPSVSPAINNQAVNKGYVDDQINNGVDIKRIPSNGVIGDGVNSGATNLPIITPSSIRLATTADVYNSIVYWAMKL